MNDHEDVYDEYEMLSDAFGPEALEVENNIFQDPNKQATKFLGNVNNVGEPIYPKNTHIQIWVEAVGGFKKNMIPGHPRLRASDIYGITFYTIQVYNKKTKYFQL